MRFDWDAAKREANIAKHGIDFLRAILVFAGPVATARSDRHSEERYTAVGMVDGRVIAVAYTDRIHGGSIVRRIISARRARTSEESAYRKAIEE